MRCAAGREPLARAQEEAGGADCFAAGAATRSKHATCRRRYGVLLGLLAVGYANFQLLSATEHPSLRGVFIRATAALTAGRPVFGFLGWSRTRRGLGRRPEANLDLPDLRPGTPHRRSLINRVPQRAIGRHASAEGGGGRVPTLRSRNASLCGSNAHGNLTDRPLPHV